MCATADFRGTTRAEHAFRNRHALDETALILELPDLVHTRRVFVRGCSFLHQRPQIGRSLPCFCPSTRASPYTPRGTPGRVLSVVASAADRTKDLNPSPEE